MNNIYYQELAIHFAPVKKYRGWIAYKDSPSPPPPPDYAAAATAQGSANVDAARATAKLSNPDVYTPYGSQTVSYGVGGDQDHGVVTQSLTPVGQQLFDQQNRISQGQGNLAEKGISTVSDVLGKPFDMSQVPAQAQAGQAGWDKAYNAIIDRNQPIQERDRAALATQLANQGITQGSEAYTNAMRDQSMKENDFALGAQQQATGQEQSQFGMDTQARQDAIQQQAYLRQLPLNEVNALRSGAQVNMPQFQAYQGTNVAPAPIFAGTQAAGQAQQGIYNAQASTAASGNAAATGLAGTAVMAAAVF